MGKFGQANDGHVVQENVDELDIAQGVAVEQHPDREGLKVATVNGQETPHQRQKMEDRTDDQTDEEWEEQQRHYDRDSYRDDSDEVVCCASLLTVLCCCGVARGASALAS